MESKIWLPNSQPKVVKLKVQVLNAQYHALHKTILLAVKLPNGELRSMPDRAKNHLFHGRPYEKVPPEEIDKEMEKTAELYRRRKPTITAEFFEDQL